MSSKLVVRIGIGAAVVAALLVGAWRLRERRSDSAGAVVPPAIDGEWRCVAIERDGKREVSWLTAAARIRLSITGETLAAPHLFGGETTLSFPPSPPGALDVRTVSEEGTVRVLRGIVAREGVTLRLALPGPDADNPRPTDFRTA